jgi:hypothetical protein
MRHFARKHCAALRTAVCGRAAICLSVCVSVWQCVAVVLVAMRGSSVSGSVSLCVRRQSVCVFACGVGLSLICFNIHVVLD